MNRAKSPCRGCGKPVDALLCPMCIMRQAKPYSDKPNLYKTTRWQAARMNHLNSNPQCVDCLAEGVVNVQQL